MASGSKIKNNLVIQGSVTASAYSGDGSALTGINTDTSNLATTSSNSFTGDQTITGSVVATGDSSRTRFLAATLNDLPSATDNHGMFAHVHATGLGYYAHAGNWIPLATSESVANVGVTIPSTYFNSSLLETENISKEFNYATSLNVIEITSSVEGAIIDYRLTHLNTGSRVGTFMYSHDGTNLSYNDLTIPGAGIGGNPALSATLTGSIVSLDIKNAAGFNFSGFAKKFSKLNTQVPIVDPNQSYTLDINPSENALAAYSVRKLSALYTGSAVRVRRNSDQTELDINFLANGGLDATSISTHCGSSPGYVTIWYDQSGNNNHISESNAAYQPELWSGTSFYTAGSKNKPALKPRGAFPLTTPNITPKGVTVVSETGAQYDVLFAGNNYADSFRTGPGYTNWLFNGTAGLFSIPMSPFGANREHHFVSIQKNTYWEGSVNTNAVTTSSLGGDLPIQCLFARSPGGYSSLNDGYGQEFIFWEDSQASNLATLKGDANNYYGIFDDGILINHPNAIAAYSVRQLTTLATSSINIRRVSNNDEQIIGFTPSGDLDKNAIETFCEGTECYVDTWYDQSGNGNDAIQDDTTKQPQIYGGGAVLTKGSKSTLKGVSNSTRLSTANVITLGGDFAVSMVHEVQTNGKMTWGHDTQKYNYHTGAGGRVNGLLSWTNVVSNGGHATYFFNRTGSSAELWQNNTSVGTGTSATGYQFQDVFNAHNNGFGWAYPLQELIFWTSSQSSSFSSIETNTNSYFNIY